jgi:hypothetical protein
MKIAIEATGTLTELDGQRVRLWEGVTERGVRCKVFVARVMVHPDADPSQFEEELKETGEPLELRRVVPLVDLVTQGDGDEDEERPRALQPERTSLSVPQR